MLLRTRTPAIKLKDVPLRKMKRERGDKGVRRRGNRCHGLLERLEARKVARRKARHSGGAQNLSGKTNSAERSKHAVHFTCQTLYFLRFSLPPFLPPSLPTMSMASKKGYIQTGRVRNMMTTSWVVKTVYHLQGENKTEKREGEW
jgi:hypothetical protein